MNNLLNLIFLILITCYPKLSEAKCVNTTVCPNFCQCSSDNDGGMILDCNEATAVHLVDVPDMIPDNVVVIDLRNNALKKINNDSFSNCTNVTSLYLSNNKISVIWNAMLRSMPKLEIISLDGDVDISYNNLSFPDDTFAGLLHLKAVSIWCYLMLGFRLSFDEYTFILQKLPNTLKLLGVSIPGGENFSQPLSKFTKLRELRIYGLSPTFNTITNDTFEPLENITIEVLRILAYNLLRVETLAFHHFPELKLLHIDGIYSLSVADFYPALIGLQHTKLEILHLSSIYSHKIKSCFVRENISRYDMVILNDSFCENLNLPHLKHLHLDSSRLYTLDRGCFSKLLNLKSLSLSFNCLSTCEIQKLSHDLKMLKNLTEINISHQYDPTLVQSDVFFSSPRNLATLDLSSILQTPADTMNFTLTVAPPPNYLNFRSNSVTVLKSFITSETNSGVSMEADFSQNNMISFEGSFDVAILEFNLTVTCLLLSENQLGKQLGEHGDKIFRYFRDLLKLDLTLNGIKQLPHSTFENLHKLEYLNLSKNALLLITFKISHMRNLKWLDLSENLVSQFNVKLQTDIDAVRFLSPNFTINMWGNPFQCSCETLSFLRWMYHRRSMFNRFEHYACTHNGEIKYFKNVEQLLNELDSQCSLLLIGVSSGLLAFLIFVIALSVFLYRHKWDVRFFFLKYVTNRKAYQELEESEQEYEYDVFVSFHSDDQDWVWNELHENLGRTEDNVGTYDQPRFRLCIHERDFVPGGLIEENILRSIESSRKTIVVLSRNFLKSPWCEFELQIARRECIERGRDLIIAVMLEPLPGDIKFSSSVERLIRKNTYIEWPTEEVERIHFWNRMRSVLTH